jgi:KaiC domain protein
MVDSKCLMSKKLCNKLNSRITSGIIGLDEMIGGGFPAGHIVVAVGDPGTGKTTLALQYIAEGLYNGEPGIYISIEEEKESIISTANSYDWDLEKHIRERKLALLKLDLSDIKTTARRMKSELPEIIKTLGARRLVIDSITLFSMTYDDPIERRLRLLGLINVIKKAGVTALFTAEVDPGTHLHSRDGIVEYAADGILSLQQSDSLKNAKLIMRVLKMRRTAHDRLYRPYEITGNGIVVDPMDTVYQNIEKNTDYTLVIKEKKTQFEAYSGEVRA